MAPEMFTSGPYQGPIVDIFAAGVVLFQMVARANPFKFSSN